MNAVYFLIGLAVPFVLNGIWFLAVNAVGGDELKRKLTRELPGAAIGPALIILACLAGAVVFWDSKRWLSYGLLTALVVAVVVFALFAFGRASSARGAA